ncbi:MAG: VWA domain-containing protein [archaeon]
MKFGEIVLTEPIYLFLIIPIFIALIWLIRKKYMNDDDRLFRSKGRKRFIVLTRTLFFLLILISLSSPTIQHRDATGNLTKLKILIDKSDSMQLYDTEHVRELQALDIPVEIKELDMKDYSDLGNQILSSLEPSQNILVVSDGQNNFGADLKDVSVFASTINSHLFGLNLEPREHDAAIYIEGPDKVVSDVDNNFIVNVNSVGSGVLRVKAYIDDVLEYSGEYDRPIVLKKKFSGGTHVLRAVLEKEDFFSENNDFYKVITVLDRPKILFVTNSKSQLYELYNDFYEVDLASNLDRPLDKYHSIILNNLPKDNIDPYFDELEKYVNDENGLFVIGGKDSYDWGEYNKSLITSMLPVDIGKAKKKKDIVSLVILMDTGASGSETLDSGVTKFDVQKALAIDVVKSISSQNIVGFIEANYYLNTLSGLSELGPKRGQLVNEIALLKPQGFSEIRFAYEKAHEALRLSRGSRNIVIITDGKIVPQDQAMTLEFVKKAKDDGIKTFIIGVGESADENFLILVKAYGGGEYFRTDETQRIKLYFGDPNDNPSTDLTTFVYDSNHFITKNLDNLGKLYGYNSVYPKSNARMLLTTSTGDPVLSIWNYGLGRVAALTSDDGSIWNPDMMKGENSQVLIRTLNWLVENPERKNDMVIDIPELRLGENSVISVKSKELPEWNLYPTGKNLYTMNFYPNRTGIVGILDERAAVNYKKEYLHIGMSGEFESALAITGGKILDLDENIAENIQSASKVETIKEENLSWYFVLGALLVYLLEIFIRRLQMIKASGEY